MKFEDAVQQVSDLENRIKNMIFGQEDLIREVLCSFLSAGHVLITGAPGLAKTTLVRVISEHLGLKFGRIQFTPDLLPSDITGSEVLNIDPETQKRSFVFSKGPLFANFILADEINRASPRTQSALLEAMQERKVTVASKSYELSEPFMVFATQNPFESEGTFPLPEAQLDRFLLHVYMTYPKEEAELRVLKEHSKNALIGEAFSFAVEKFLSAKDILKIMDCVRKISLSDELLQAINDLVRSSRPEDPYCPEGIAKQIWYGAGPRAGLSLISAAKSLALIDGQEFVSWKHIRRLAKPVLRHRVRLSLAATRDQISIDETIDTLLASIEEKHIKLALA